MFETVAAVFGMSVDDTVKLIGATSTGAAVIIGAITKLLIRIRGARKRSFKKIRRIEDILLAVESERTGGAPYFGLYAEMKADQRDHADEKDSE